jgi:hypothetical protein
MRSFRPNTFGYLLLSAVLTIMLSYLFGNDGHEAFLTTTLALGILMTWLSIQLIRLNFGSRQWFAVKLFALIPLSFLWFVSVSVVMLAVLPNGHESLAVNWFVVAMSTLPYFFNRLEAVKKSRGISIDVAATLYSLLILYVAGLSFREGQSPLKNLLLVIAMQLQLIMAYLTISSGLLQKAHVVVNRYLKRFKMDTTDFGLLIGALVLGLPFFLPVIIVIVLSAIPN